MQIDASALMPQKPKWVKAHEEYNNRQLIRLAEKNDIPGAVALVKATGGAGTYLRLTDAALAAIRKGNKEFVYWAGTTSADLEQMLQEAAQSGHLELVQWLISVGAKDYDPALLAAASEGRAAVVDVLYAEGASEVDSVVMLASLGGHLSTLRSALGIAKLMPLDPLSPMLIQDAVTAAKRGDHQAVVTELLEFKKTLKPVVAAPAEAN